MSSTCHQQQQQQQPEWTALLTKLLANLILDQVRKGNTANNSSSLSNKAWNFITHEFHTRSGGGGLKLDKEHLKHRFALLAREFSLVKLILSRDNFVFDESTGCIIATDESWDQYVKECPDAEAVLFTNSSLRYSELFIISRRRNHLCCYYHRREGLAEAWRLLSPMVLLKWLLLRS